MGNYTPQTHMTTNMTDVQSDSSVITQPSHVPTHLQRFLRESNFLILRLTSVVFRNYKTLILL